MAEGEDRTEAATPRRLERAREGGQAPLTREMATATVLILASVGLAVAAKPASGLGGAMAAMLAGIDREEPVAALTTALMLCVKAVLPVAAAVLLAGSGAILLQTGFLFHGSACLPDLSRLDPRRGLARIAGPSALLETGKSLLKVAIVGAILYRVLRHLRGDLDGSLFWNPARLMEGLRGHVEEAVMAVAIAQAVIAGADMLRARLQHARGLRMSRQEVREEQKEADGDPQIKAKRRSLQRQRARRRMLAAVPKATVVVTNPTHYAVALAYERGTQAAPKVVAKGVDEMAARIRETATSHRVPLVANPPLARALYQVELDREVPAEHYKAVAEIIAYVWRLSGRAAMQAGR